mgnify:CR=1 FL=1
MHPGMSDRPRSQRPTGMPPTSDAYPDEFSESKFLALVRGAAVWALSRLDRARFASLAAQQRSEPDDSVRDEWTVALESAR